MWQTPTTTGLSSYFLDSFGIILIYKFEGFKFLKRMERIDISLVWQARKRGNCGIQGRFIFSWRKEGIIMNKNIRKVAVMKTSGKFVVCDRGNERSRMQIFTKHGHFVRKIAIRYIDIVAGLAITRDGNIGIK